MTFELDKAIIILNRTPKTLYALLKNLPEDWTHKNEGKDTWSPFDVLGHLVHGEKTDWIERAKIILENETDKTFLPFDRFAQYKDSEGKSINDLLEEFKLLRQNNIEILKGLQLTESDFKREGLHPNLGKVTLEQLLATWVTHDLAHIAQIIRVMAKQYKYEVGPWSEYIGILNE